MPLAAFRPPIILPLAWLGSIGISSISSGFFFTQSSICRGYTNERTHLEDLSIHVSRVTRTAACQYADSFPQSGWIRHCNRDRSGNHYGLSRGWHSDAWVLPDAVSPDHHCRRRDLVSDHDVTDNE